MLLITVLVESGQPQYSVGSVVQVSDCVVDAFTTSLMYAEELLLHGFIEAYCAPDTAACCTLIFCEKARPRSMTGDKTARRTGAASPNSTADIPLPSRAIAPIHAN